MKRALWAFRLSSVLFAPALFLLSLRQWRTDHPWSRLNLYSVSFLVLGVVAAVAEAVTFAPSAFQDREVAREAFGLSYDPALFRCGMVLNAAVLLVVLDYGQWHLEPILERPFLQITGLALGILGVLWQIWADAWLAHHFRGGLSGRRLMTGGPFYWVRHPRYAAFLTRKVAWPLLLASIIGWVLLPIWLVLVLRRMGREEAHLTELFGAKYGAYARRTARLVPGVY